MTSADIGLTMQYSDLNQPQTIKAPTSVSPFTQFQSKLSAFVQALQGAAAGALGSRHQQRQQRWLQLERRDQHRGGIERRAVQPVHPAGRRRRHQDAEVRVAAQ